MQIENPPDPPDNYGGRDSPYENVNPIINSTRRPAPRKRPSTLPLFIGNHTNIDDLLGEEVNPPHNSVMSHVRKHECAEGMF